MHPIRAGAEPWRTVTRTRRWSPPSGDIFSFFFLNYMTKEMFDLQITVSPKPRRSLDRGAARVGDEALADIRFHTGVGGADTPRSWRGTPLAASAEGAWHPWVQQDPIAGFDVPWKRLVPITAVGKRPWLCESEPLSPSFKREVRRCHGPARARHTRETQPERRGPRTGLGHRGPRTGPGRRGLRMGSPGRGLGSWRCVGTEFQLGRWERPGGDGGDSRTVWLGFVPPSWARSPTAYMVHYTL